MSTKVTNWKTDPKVQMAKGIAINTKSDIVIVLTVSDSGVEMFSYGVTGKLCTMGGKLGDAAFDGVMAYLEEN